MQMRSNTTGSFAACKIFEEHFRMNRFGENLEMMPVCLGALKKICSSGLAGKENNLAGGLMLSDVDCHINTTDSAQNHIADQDVRVHLGGHFNSLLAAVNRFGLVAACIKNECQR